MYNNWFKKYEINTREKSKVNMMLWMQNIRVKLNEYYLFR